MHTEDHAGWQLQPWLHAARLLKGADLVLYRP
jgi:hypothetical protein